MKRQQLPDGPEMVCDPRRHGRRRLLYIGQTLMGRVPAGCGYCFVEDVSEVLVCYSLGVYKT